MREHSPVHHDEVNDLWGVATYAGVLAVGRDPATFSNVVAASPTPARCRG